MVCADLLRTFRSSIRRCRRVVMRKLLSRAECSFGYKHYALPEGAFSCLKSIRDIALLSRAYRVAVLFNPLLSDDRPYNASPSHSKSVSNLESWLAVKILIKMAQCLSRK